MKCISHNDIRQEIVMAKFNVSLVTAALDALTGACSVYAAAGTAVTAALCGALKAGANVVECVDAAQCGFELAGADMPQGFASNIKRLHAAGSKMWAKAEASELALNNRLLIAIDCPKLATSGAKKKAKAKPAAKVAANDDKVSVSPLLAALRSVRELNVHVVDMRDAKGGLLPSEVSSKLKDILSEAAAILAQFAK
jgi:hypothetical protein